MEIIEIGAASFQALIMGDACQPPATQQLTTTKTTYYAMIDKCIKQKTPRKTPPTISKTEDKEDCDAISLLLSLVSMSTALVLTTDSTAVSETDNDEDDDESQLPHN